MSAADHPICRTCGVQHDGSRGTPAACAICEDERQYVGWGGQRWTTMAELRAARGNRVEEEDADLWGVGTEPSFAIGQRALLVRSPAGNVLWDCISLLDDATVEAVDALGGVAAIAVSHPHFHGSMVEWSRAFGDVPVYVHAADREWVMRPDDRIVHWEGTARPLDGGITLVNCGVHFAGGTVLHWEAGAGGTGAVLSGDIFQVVMDRRWVSFMYSYPNLIPEHPDTVVEAVRRMEPYRFSRIHGAWWGRTVARDAKRALARSADRYLRHIGTEYGAGPRPV